jgi:hypothetical protein
MSTCLHQGGSQGVCRESCQRFLYESSQLPAENEFNELLGYYINVLDRYNLG